MVVDKSVELLIASVLVHASVIDVVGIVTRGADASACLFIAVEAIWAFLNTYTKVVIRLTRERRNSAIRDTQLLISKVPHLIAGILILADSLGGLSKVFIGAFFDTLPVDIRAI